MEHHRGTTNLRDLARGPGRLAQALRIDRSLDGVDLCNPGEIWLGADGAAGDEVGANVRVALPATRTGCCASSSAAARSLAARER